MPLLYHHIRRHCEDRDFSSPFVFLLNNVYIILYIAVFVTVDIHKVYTLAHKVYTPAHKVYTLAHKVHTLAHKVYTLAHKVYTLAHKVYTLAHG
jgi:hypothetical protein